jgi:ketopantoate reductase
LISIDKLNILVFGSGAIGTYVGGSLALSGNRVTFIEQPKAVEELRARGLMLEVNNVQYSVNSIQYPVRFAPSLEEAFQSAPFDFAIYALKSFDTASFLVSLAGHVSSIPPVLCLSNGVDNEPDLAARRGRHRVGSTARRRRGGWASALTVRLESVGRGFPEAVPVPAPSGHEMVQDADQPASQCDSCHPELDGR